MIVNPSLRCSCGADSNRAEMDPDGRSETELRRRSRPARRPQRAFFEGRSRECAHKQLAMATAMVLRTCSSVRPCSEADVHERRARLQIDRHRMRTSADGLERRIGSPSLLAGRSCLHVGCGAVPARDEDSGRHR